MTETDLLDAIDVDPTDPEPRLRLINCWSYLPKADLIRLLVYLPASESEGLIKDWFASHEGWPRRLSQDHDKPPCGCWSLPYWRVEPWLYFAFDPERWPDQAKWHAGVVAMARRRLLNAREAFPPDDRTRTILEGLAASQATEPSRPSPAELAGEDAEAHVRAHHQRNHWPAVHAIYEGQTVAALIYDFIGSDPGSGSEFEISEQFHVLGWSWLGLPPLRPEARSEQPSQSKKPGATDLEDWPDAAITRDRTSAPWWRRLRRQ